MLLVKVGTWKLICSSVDRSIPTILRPWVRIISTTSALYFLNLNGNVRSTKNQKEAGIGPFFNSNFNGVMANLVHLIDVWANNVSSFVKCSVKIFNSFSSFKALVEWGQTKCRETPAAP